MFLLSIVEEEVGDNVADMIVCSTDENLLRTPSSNSTPACSETLKRLNEALHRFRIYPLSYEALSNLTRPCSVALRRTPGLCLGANSVFAVHS